MKQLDKGTIPLHMLMVACAVLLAAAPDANRALCALAYGILWTVGTLQLVVLMFTTRVEQESMLNGSGIMSSDTYLHGLWFWVRVFIACLMCGISELALAGAWLVGAVWAHFVREDRMNDIREMKNYA